MADDHGDHASETEGDLADAQASVAE
jgi:hypothetical protein